MQQHTLVLVKAWNSWPGPVVQNPRSIYEDIAMVCDLPSAVKVLHMHIVSAPLVVPVCARHLVFCLDKFVQPVFPREIIEIVEDFARACIDGGPVELRFE